MLLLKTVNQFWRILYSIAHAVGRHSLLKLFNIFQVQSPHVNTTVQTRTNLIAKTDNEFLMPMHCPSFFSQIKQSLKNELGKQSELKLKAIQLL